VYTTHIAHGLTPLSDTTKLLQTQEALEWIEATGQDEAAPDVFVGDFNSEEGSAVHDEVTGAGWTDTYRKANRTAKGFTSDQDPRAPKATVGSRIDYVFARPGTCGLTVRSSAVIANRVYRVAGKPLWPSDHYGLVSEIACGSRGAR
jgi:endonuclease/exonuclease/phosphatase family metal-dependent hydrolase